MTSANSARPDSLELDGVRDLLVQAGVVVIGVGGVRTGLAQSVVDLLEAMMNLGLSVVDLRTGRHAAHRAVAAHRLVGDRFLVGVMLAVQLILHALPDFVN